MKVGKRNKSPDTRPARARYWSKRSLERNKSRRVAKNTGLPLDEALKLWRVERNKKRMKSCGPVYGSPA